MTPEPGAEPASVPVPTRAVDGRTMIGHAIVCQTRDGDQDAFAIWQVNTMGVNTGAWIVPADAARTDPAAARRVLDLCRRRAITDWEPSVPLALLAELDRTAGLAPCDRGTSAIALPTVLTEIADIRSALEKRVVEERQAKKNIVTLEWEIDVPDPVPATADELRRYARLGWQTAYPAAREALLFSSLLHWCVQRWQETITAIRRRDYLRDSYAPAGTLPPNWEARLADAFG